MENSKPKFKLRFSDVAIAAVVFIVVLLIIVPLPPIMLDLFIIINISISILILLMAIFTTEPLQFSIFPPLLLLVTIFRLALNISSTRQILGGAEPGYAGEVIKTFGEFVAGGNLIVGFIIFLIIIIVQFIVITKGSERVSEVAARFTLDAMPGKQMAIDADLNTGAIDDKEAKRLRAKIQKEADFYGAMDGASKFVKGDAIVAILTVFINIVGGIITGFLVHQLAASDVFNIYTIATVGEGLVAQLSALMVSTASGIVVTKTATEDNLGRELAGQIIAKPNVLVIGGGMVFLISFIPGLPKLPMFIVSISLIAFGLYCYRNFSLAPEDNGIDVVETDQDFVQNIKKKESVLEILQIDPIEIEFGYSLVPLIDPKHGSDFANRIIMIRRQCAFEMGIVLPNIRLRDNVNAGTNEYVLKVKGLEVARGEVYMNNYLALNASGIDIPIDGLEVIEPTFGLPAVWIDKADREKAEVAGYTIIDPPSAIATHLTEILKQHAFELVDREQVKMLVDNLKEKNPSLVEDVVPKVVSYGALQKILKKLLKEGLSVRDLATIVETAADNINTVDDDVLVEYVRSSLKRYITSKFAENNKIEAITLNYEVEQAIAEGIRRSEQGTYLNIDPAKHKVITQNLKTAIEKMYNLSITPIILTSPLVRAHVKSLLDPISPSTTVLSFAEIEQNVMIDSKFNVTL